MRLLSIYGPSPRGLKQTRPRTSQHGASARRQQAASPRRKQLVMSVRRLRFVGDSDAGYASAAGLEKEHGELMLRDTRVTRAITVSAACVGYLTALLALQEVIYAVGLAIALFTLVLLLVLPGRANTLMSIFFLPASAGVCT